MDRKTILELVRKVKKLADKGVGGEASAAKIKLKKLYEKYNLTDSDFVELQEVSNRYFIFRHTFDKQLLSNLTCMILESPTFSCGENNNVLRIKMTDEQYDNVTEAFEYYKKMFDEYSKYLMQAIISRNAIGYIPKKPTTQESPSPQPDQETPPAESSAKEKEQPEFDMIKLMKLAVAIESKPWQKLPEHKNLPESDMFDTVDKTNHAKTGNNSIDTESTVQSKGKNP